MAGLRQGDIGSVIRVRIMEGGQPLDISLATSKIIKLGKPDGTVVEKAGSFDGTAGVNGVLTYTTIANDLDQFGPWTGQVAVTLPDGSWHTDPFTFMVGEILEV